jgi:dihydroneopterin aldolase
MSAGRTPPPSSDDRREAGGAHPTPPRGSGPGRTAGGAGREPPAGADAGREDRVAISRDRIRLSGLRVFARAGVLAHEQALGQVLVVDVELGLDLAPAGTMDDLRLTVDYGRFAGAVAELVRSGRRRLIEAVAEDVARLALGDPRVNDVRVRVAKPHAPLPVDAEVSVEIERRRDDREAPRAGGQEAGRRSGAHGPHARRPEADSTPGGAVLPPKGSGGPEQMRVPRSNEGPDGRSRSGREAAR